MAGTVLLDVQAGIALITLNRPETRNAIDAAMRRELTETVRTAAHDPSVRALVFRGAGERAFCAGADIKEFVPPHSLVDAREERTGPKWTDAIAACRKPTVAAVHGYCLGGGLEIALACDLRVATEDAVFGLPEVRRAILPGAGGTQRLPRLVGLGPALRMILTGEHIDAAEALRIGLVGEVVATGSLEDAVRRLAEAFRRVGPRAVAYAKEAVLRGADLPLSEGLRVEGELSTLLTTTQDRVEGAAAFRERRDPVYTGQ
ncbi:enoyl-CoA hydratase [Streptomyces sp. Amel2xB2]|uniref:enoyl-CoA hydratase/isomerase family protein n=1 Tax=Streptomyces sp. Amel2xB2 TaxID=1305829 RepID=UPI000DB92483|nr:enoyl-CoA hydratase/isomerase family protein [Streptomyces sp. Amel2xB2]RAJ59072.1 enoyl-CoA hydratase [Streptomyces sp. Amel2xB2]